MTRRAWLTAVCVAPFVRAMPPTPVYCVGMDYAEAADRFAQITVLVNQRTREMSEIAKAMVKCARDFERLSRG